MSGLHRDINVCGNFLSSRRLQKRRERTGGRAGLGAGRPPSPLGPIKPRLADYAPPGFCDNQIMTIRACFLSLSACNDEMAVITEGESLTSFCDHQGTSSLI